MDAATLTLPPPTQLVVDAASSARNFMVDSQLRPNKITDTRLLNAMRALPRERFVPADRQAVTYMDADIRLPNGRFMLAPMTLGKLLQLAFPDSTANILVVGAGTGYSAAVLAAYAGKVTALESDETLLAIARPALAEFAPAVALTIGDLRQGWPASAPYDLILVEGGVTAIPAAIAAQLTPNTGRLITVEVSKSGVGRAAVGENTGGKLHLRPAFDASAPLLTPLTAPGGFVF